MKLSRGGWGGGVEREEETESGSSKSSGRWGSKGEMKNDKFCHTRTRTQNVIECINSSVSTCMRLLNKQGNDTIDLLSLNNCTAKWLHFSS